jgi:proline dehydrogenase
MFLNNVIVSIVRIMPEKLVWIFSKKYIAGKMLSDALQVTKDFNSRNIRTTIDLLGEYLTRLEKINQYKKEYLSLIKVTSEYNLDNSYSLKPSMFGLLIDEEICYSNVRDLVEKAASNGKFIRIDMEDSSCIVKEIDLYKKLHSEFPQNVGIVLQAYMKRTVADIDDLARLQPLGSVNIRICKGIYNEPAGIAFKKMHEINSNFLAALEQMFRNNIYAGIATHDKLLIEGAIELIKKYKVSNDRFEFQMLYGVTPEMGNKIRSMGYNLRVYVPYGQDWFNYSTRRLKENPGMVFHIIKALFKAN